MEKKSEISYQRERAAKIAQVIPTPDQTIERYRKCRRWRLFPKECMFRYLQDIARKNVLDIGCGEGIITTQLARLGGYVTAIDLSADLVEIAKRRADLDGVRERIEFIVGDVTDLPLPKSKFDFAVCNAVLHHVDIYAAVPHILRCLKPGGIVTITEPIAFSPLLQKFRDIIPIAKDVSPGEHQLNREDIDFLLGNLSNTQISFFNLFGRFSRLFPNKGKIISIILGNIDSFLLDLFPFLSRFCGIAVIAGQRKSNE